MPKQALKEGIKCNNFQVCQRSMIRFILRCCATGLILLFFSHSGFGQKKAIPTEMGLNMGGCLYRGDVGNIRLTDTRPSAELFFRINPSPVVSLRIGALVGRFRGDETTSKDVFKQKRGAQFRTTAYEFNLRAEYNFRDYRSTRELSRACPYLFGGVGGALLRVDNPFTPTEYMPALVLPMGVGMKYTMSYNWNLGIEFGSRFTFSDRIDALADDPGNGKFGRANPFTRDMYYVFNVGLCYTFEWLNCPIKFSR
ncbi:MAG: hypothetical protein EAZ57_08580 [Cytophagales bacterium]|nr:MAG: hypothetical protein EAZ67_09390 [Cytophagales bacterium]TAF60082.1 MAG: hypothetical protein EAZ57_08580 [Cytophagales bacterium]